MTDGGESPDVAHVIGDVGTGGAQRALARLAVSLTGRGVGQHVIVLSGPEGAEGDRLRQRGIPVTGLGASMGPSAVRGLWGLTRLLCRLRPRAVHGWMYHAALAAGLAARAAGRPPVVWGIRHGTMPGGDVRTRTRWVARMAGSLSSLLPARIVYNSRRARAAHAEMGYRDGRAAVIPNGFDLDRFRPDAGAGRAVRREFGLDPEDPLVGMVAEARPQKDHPTFVRAAARLAADGPDAHFLLCGAGTGPSGPVEELIRAEGGADLRRRFHLLGLRRDVPAVLNALDVATLTSRSGESFPNVVGEAMACGVPVVVTDVGDAGRIVGGAGRVVEPGEPSRVAAAWSELLRAGREERRRLGLMGRVRVADRYGQDAVTERYLELYRELEGVPETLGGGRR